MNEIDVIEWLESKVPKNDSDLKLHSMAATEITRLRKRVNELERELKQRDIEGESFVGTHE